MHPSPIPQFSSDLFAFESILLLNLNLLHFMVSKSHLYSHLTKENYLNTLDFQKC